MIAVNLSLAAVAFWSAFKFRSKKTMIRIIWGAIGLTIILSTPYLVPSEMVQTLLPHFFVYAFLYLVEIWLYNRTFGE